MRVSAEIYYDADPAAVMAMLTDPAFQERKCAATGALSSSVAIEGDDDGPVTITTRRTMPTDEVPDFARSYVGQTLEVVHTDSWQAPGGDGSRRGEVLVEITGLPVRLTGTQRMAAADDGTTTVVEGDLKASVPLFGSKIEKAVEPAMRAALRKEQDVGTAWLAEH